MPDQEALFSESSYSGALFDDSESYRYLLWRRWAAGRALLWIMLNPSTADATKLDPTLRRCIDYTRRFGFPAMEIGNAYAYRSTDPKKLWTVDDPVGPDNMRHLEDAVRRSAKVILGWGVHAKPDHATRVYEMIVASGKQPHALAVSEKTHAPRHPLYLRKTLVPVPWRPAA